MYAETFNVRPWLEDQAKWLRWAMQSLTAWNSTDARYNLKQFWATLATAKTKAQTQQDWSELLTLDAQSKWALGNLYQHDASDLLKQVNDYSAARNFAIYTSPIIAVAGLANITDPTLSVFKTKLEGFNQGAAQAFAEQKTLAEQAVQASRSAGVSSQAGNTVTVAENAIRAAANEAESRRRQLEAMGKTPDVWKDLKETLVLPILGVPMWAWLAGGVALLVLITTGPSLAQGYAMRRAVED